MKLNRYIAVIIAVLLVGAVSVSAQVVNANLTGNVTMDKNPLPGVTVTVASPNMIGTRTTTTDVNGNYNFAAVPAGTYKVTFEMQGMQNITRNVQVGVGQTGRADAEMRLTAVAEAITVTASAPAVLETTEISSNMQQSTINKLPTSRTVIGVALLAPGTTSTGPRGAITMSGATADQNLITVDGAVIQENLRGQTHGLFIEDAIQETTVLTGAISAEYGRFTGGVVNSITKSGGNEFHGSYRDNIDRGTWTDVTPFPTDLKGLRSTATNQVHEGTFGGRIIRDRLWFFAAGRKTKSTAQQFFSAGGTPFNIITDAKRYEGKLTGQLTPKHSLVTTYLNSPLKATNNCQLGCIEQNGLDPAISQGNNFYSGHYNGIITNNLLIEGLYSRKTFAFIGFGGDSTDPVIGTPVLGYNSGGSFLGVANAAYFCGVCGNEKRNNNSWNLKSTYFWSTKGLGTHNLVGGVERWAESRFSNNYQSATGFLIDASPGLTRDANGNAIFNAQPDTAYIEYLPIVTPSLGSDLKTKSVFGNDKWDLNTHWSFNLGARYDKNDSLNSLHQKIADDSNFSPRVGLNYDVLGNGKYRLTAGYNVYVGRLAEGVSAQGSPAGSPSDIYFVYEGPAINGVTSRELARQMMAWFNSVGGINAKDLIVAQSVPGVNVQLGGKLKSPNVREYTVGGGMQIGNGFARVDYVDRDWKDFYANFTNLSTGKVTDSTGVTKDLTLVRNTNSGFERKYKALQTQLQYRLFNNLQLGSNYTYSRLRGNAVQENAGSGPISEGGFIFGYPEYNGFRNNSPIGPLPSDQTHKLRAWASYDMHTWAGNLNLSAIQRYESGVPYSAIGTINTSWYIAANPGYVNPPATTSYYFSKRGAFRTDSLRSTDLSATFSFPTIHGVEFYAEGYVFNATNNKSIVNVINPAGTNSVIDTGVITARSSTAGLARFNPFTATHLIECPSTATAAECTALGANFKRSATFGSATAKQAYQTPRSYSMALGLRF